MKIIYQDVETGGLNPKTSSLLQLSGAIEIDGELKEEFDFKMLPVEEDDPIEEEAIAIHGLNPEKNPEEFMSAIVGYTKYINLLDKYINKYNTEDKFYFVGYNNNHFDEPFIRNFMLKQDNKYYGSYFWTPSIDMFLLTGFAAMGKRHIFKNFKLITVAESLGIEVDETKAHDALYDVYLTKELFKEFTKEYPY